MRSYRAAPGSAANRRRGGSHPNERRTPVRYLRTNCSRDPYAYGAYSYPSRRSALNAATSALTLAEKSDENLLALAVRTLEGAYPARSGPAGPAKAMKSALS